MLLHCSNTFLLSSCFDHSVLFFGRKQLLKRKHDKCEAELSRLQTQVVETSLMHQDSDQSSKLTLYELNCNLSRSKRVSSTVGSNVELNSDLDRLACSIRLLLPTDKTYLLLVDLNSVRRAHWSQKFHLS